MDSPVMAHEVAEGIKYKSRNFCLMLYPDEDTTHQAALDYIRANYRYAAICHNLDKWTSADEAQNPEHKAGELKKSHWHVVLQFACPRWNTALAKELGLSDNYIRQCRSLEASLKYLVHADHSDKVQYETDCVEGPLKVLLDKALLQLTEDERILQILKLLDSFGCKVSFDAFTRLVCSKGLYADFRRSAYIMSQLIAEHNNLFES